MSLRQIVFGVIIGLAILWLLKSPVNSTRRPPEGLWTESRVSQVSYAPGNDLAEHRQTRPAARPRREISKPVRKALNKKPLPAPAKSVKTPQAPTPTTATAKTQRESIEATTANAQEPATRIQKLLRESIQPATLRVASADELYEFEQLFLWTLTEEKPWNRLESTWSQLGWRLLRWESNRERFAAICEQENQRYGRGIYILRLDSKSRVAIQAPHRFYDTHTGVLARKWFEENEVLAAAWNTVHRKQLDLAHRRDHYINAMTRALLRYDSETVIAQVHGFANDKQSGAAATTAMIISDTSKYPGRLAQIAAANLKSRFGSQAVGLYPIEVTELGGTQNEQGRLFHEIGRRGFLHVELNRATREYLMSDASKREAFFSALTAATDIWQKPRDR